MTPINSKVYSLKLTESHSLFVFDNTLYEVNNKVVKPITEAVDDKTSSMMKLIEASNNIALDDESKLYNDGEKEYETIGEELLVDGVPVEDTEDINKDTLDIMETLSQVKTSDITMNEAGTEEFSVDGVEEDVTISEDDGEPTIVDNTPPTEEDEEQSIEVDLILEKIGDINLNIEKLEAMDMSQREDIQQVYIDEMGKKAILSGRLKELDYEYEDPKKTIVDTLVESTSYHKFGKTAQKTFLRENKVGSMVLIEALSGLKSKFVKTINESEHTDLGKFSIDKAKGSDEYVMSGEISEVTDDEILIVDSEDALMEAVDKLVEAGNPDISKQIVQWEDGGKAFFKLDDEGQYAFEDWLNNNKEPYGDTSQTGNDIVYYNTNKWDSSLKKLREEKEPTKIEPAKPLDDSEIMLEDFSSHTTKCDLYESENGLTPIQTEDNSLAIPKDTVLRFNEQNDVFLTEDNDVVSINKNFVEAVEAVEEEELEIGKMYEHIQGKAKYKLVESVDDANGLTKTHLFIDSMGEYFELGSKSLPFTMKK